MRQQLKINNIWAVLPQNFKVTIKRTNPLFNNEGDFSFPFSLDPRLNKPIIESACDPHGRFSLRRLNGLPIEYWFDGQLMFRGYTEVKDSLQFKDTIQLNFNSGVRSITEQVKDMNAQDVSVERWQLGYACTGFRAIGVENAYYENNNNGQRFMVNLHRPAFDTNYNPSPVKNALYTFLDSLNTSKDSRVFPYCNTRLALDVSNDNHYRVLDYNRRDSAPCMYVLYWLKRLFKDLGISLTNEFEQMEDMTRLAFFSTFPKYTIGASDINPANGISVEDGIHEGVTVYKEWEKWADGTFPQEDFGAPFTIDTEFHHGVIVPGFWYKIGSNHSVGYISQKAQPENKYRWHDNVGLDLNDKKYTLSEKDRILYGFRPAFLSSEQYPDTKVQTILDDLHDIFGLRIIYDTVTNHARVLYIKDVFANAPVLPFPAEFHTDPIVTRQLNPGIIISYGKERDSNSFSVAEAAYDYDMPENERMVVQQPFSDTLNMVFSSTDHKTYYDPKTGNAAVIAVDEDSEDPKQGATPFEVGQWNDYRYAVNDEDNAKTYKPNFEPIVCNDITNSETGIMPYRESNLCPFVDAQQTLYPNDSVFNPIKDSADEKEMQSQMYETFLDDQEPHAAIFVYDEGGKLIGYNDHQTKLASYSTVEHTDIAYLLCSDANHSDTEQMSKILTRLSILIHYASNNGECCDMTKDDSPLQKWQDGKHYVLGFMRGAGNDSGIEYDSETYNDDGTRGWKSVVGTPTFTADSVDQFGNVFDYNGKETGGIDQSERLSLKLDARKVKSYDEEGNPTFYPIDADLANRGVAVKMLSSFLHFETHHHKVTRKATVAVGFIMNIDWCAQYDMQQCVGFVNSIQFELSENGVGESTIEQLVME